ncbi:TolC family protein [Catenovulum sp. 2E275]|uniref:TolC family protein n=1 Tax=Catenovulum sp. 2E275 TaxID=2980497 RepID=UPI0021CE7588|nr:TolC family protein [Catenovulum sp. 2E275]MCU4677275.1 TolC family protein [Catenovulum sp. 2E275]
MKNFILCLTVYSLSGTLAAADLSFNQAIHQAFLQDVWQTQSQQQELALQAQSSAENTLPNPKMSLNLMNLPTDSWQFNQQAMTQMSIGISQTFNRGDSAQIQQNLLSTQANMHPLMRQARQAQVKQTVGLLWLDAYLAKQNIEIIQASESLFEQMADIATAHYSTAQVNTRQQDVIRAQLERTQLQDQQFQYQQNLQSALGQLRGWIAPQNEAVVIADNLPRLNEQVAEKLLLSNLSQRSQSLFTELNQHPNIKLIDLQQDIANQKVSLKQQAYKPQWAVSANYGYRADAPDSSPRSDFFSIGVSFDLPVFNQGSLDKAVDAQIYQTEAVKTQKRLVLKQFFGQLQAELEKLKQLTARHDLYQTNLLNQFEEQAEAALTAYTNDDGDFAEVVRSRIAQLNSQMAALKIQTDILKSWLKIEYFLAPVEQNLVIGQETIHE